MEKRTWCYIQQPAKHEMAACSCGNVKTQWSEYKEHLWCANCEKDFIPEHSGVFSGPIPIMTSRMLGLSFDRFNIITEQAEILDESSLPSNLHYVPCFDVYCLFQNKQVDVDVKYFVDNKFLTENATLSYQNGELKIELKEKLNNFKAKNFNVTINFGYPQTKSFNLDISINDDLKTFIVNANEKYTDFLKYVNKNELKYILTQSNS